MKVSRASIIGVIRKIVGDKIGILILGTLNNYLLNKIADTGIVLLSRR